MASLVKSTCLAVIIKISPRVLPQPDSPHHKKVKEIDKITLLRLYKSPSSRVVLAPPVLPFSKNCRFLSLEISFFSLYGLANSQDESSRKNQEVVLALYDALRSRDVSTVQKILAPDLEWWFHGPPSHQFLMRILTGADTAANSVSSGFEFKPESVRAFDSIVIAEGCDPTRSISWIHAWTVSDGIISQVREYFNTSLTVTRFGNQDHDQSPAGITPVHCPSVWESSLSSRVGKSVPGLVLAI